MKLDVNGREREVKVPEDTPLLWVLRDDLQLTGTKYGCGLAQCGSCTVHLDGRPVRSCTTPVGRVGEAKITTIEGVSGRVAEAVQQAWHAADVPQCGYCQSGQVMAAVALLERNAKPSVAEIDAALKGNVCRCATCHRIRLAIQDASRSLEG